MSSDANTYPVAVSRIGEGDTREQQTARAIEWIGAQSGGPITVVTPQKRLESETLTRFLARPGVTHLSWRGLSAGQLTGNRVVHAWPDRQRLNDLWGVDIDALVVIEHGGSEAAEWIEDANPIHLLADGIVPPLQDSAHLRPVEDGRLPEDVGGIHEYLARWAAGYSSGLKWNEKDKLKADMMNRPERWASVSVEQVRAKCRELRMRPNDVDTIAGLLQGRKDGRRFNVGSSYRDFRFS